MTQRTPIEELKLSGSGNLKRALALPDLDAKRHDPGIPIAPDHLTESERTVFDRVAALLTERNVVTLGDVEVIGVYSVIYCRWQRERELLDKEGTITEKLICLTKDHNGVYEAVINPRLKIVRSAEIQLANLARELCLTPRTRGSCMPTKKQKSGEDCLREIDEMLGLTN